VQIRLMQPTDFEVCNNLRSQVGWNQLREDWFRFRLLSKNGCFICELDQRAVGTVTTIEYQRRIGWIGMLIVHPECRGKGIGKALLETAVDSLKTRGVRSIKLDATPQGERLYARIGFQREYQITRWETTSPKFIDQLPQRILDSDLHQIAALDEAAFGANRKELLQELQKQSIASAVSRQHNSVRGFGILRRGSVADYLSPIVAEAPEIAASIVNALLSRVDNQKTFWDLPDFQTNSLQPQSWGFSAQRALTRMWLGEPGTAHMPAWYFGLADPACG
jgi:ribosomal protein S18 acetylase RimI-like enzyme